MIWQSLFMLLITLKKPPIHPLLCIFFNFTRFHKEHLLTIYRKRRGVHLFHQLSLLHLLLPCQIGGKRWKTRGRAQWVRGILFSCVIPCMCFQHLVFRVFLILLCCELGNFITWGEKNTFILQNESLEISVCILPLVLMAPFRGL